MVKLKKLYSSLMACILIFCLTSYQSFAVEEAEISEEIRRSYVKFFTHKKDGKLWVRLKANSSEFHELMVWLPDETSLVLVLKDVFISEPLKGFKSGVDYYFPADDLVGKYWVGGQGYETSVFGMEGIYRFYFADNIETEPTNAFHDEIEVNFMNDPVNPTCTYDLQDFQKTILTHIPPVQVISTEIDQTYGNILIDIGSKQKLNIGFEACFSKIVKIQIDHVEAEFLENTVRMIKPLILLSVGNIEVEIETLMKKVQEGKSFNRRINERNSKVRADVLYYYDGTIHFYFTAHGQG